MRSQAVVAAAVLTCALLSGGWLVERGSRSGVRDAASQARLLDEVFQHLRHDYVDSLADSTLYRRAVAGVLHELHDPHSVFLDPKRLGTLNESTSGHYAGVGIQMDVRDSGIMVLGTLPGTSAERVGILAGDRIVEIDGKPTTGLTSEETIKTLRGPPGSTVRVSVDRQGSATRIPFTLTRSVIEVNPVQHALLLPESDAGYVDLSVFSAAAAADLRHAIDSLRGAGAKSLVLDLRGNHGGSFTAGVETAKRLLPGGIIVTTQGQVGEVAGRVFSSDSGMSAHDVPLVVLIDTETASAAELVAAALKDNNRATLVGMPSFGKGAVQYPVKLTSLDSVDDTGKPLARSGTVRLTIAKLLSPRGVPLNGVGVIPNVIEPDPIGQLDKAYLRALDLLPTPPRTMIPE